jgi:hypothetical protein
MVDTTAAYRQPAIRLTALSFYVTNCFMNQIAASASPINSGESPRTVCQRNQVHACNEMTTGYPNDALLRELFATITQFGEEDIAKSFLQIPLIDYVHDAPGAAAPVLYIILVT